MRDGTEKEVCVWVEQRYIEERKREKKYDQEKLNRKGDIGRNIEKNKKTLKKWRLNK